MIKSKNGIVELEGEVADVYADLGCAIASVFKGALVTTFGKERAEQELRELIDIVLANIDEIDEEEE